MLFFDNNGVEGAESNSQGVTNAQLFSRQVPSPIGLPFQVNKKTLFSYLVKI